MDIALELVKLEMLDRSALLQKVAGLRASSDRDGSFFSALMKDPRTAELCVGFSWERAGSPCWDSPDLPTSALRSYAHALIARATA